MKIDLKVTLEMLDHHCDSFSTRAIADRNNAEPLALHPTWTHDAAIALRLLAAEVRAGRAMSQPGTTRAEGRAIVAAYEQAQKDTEAALELGR